MKKLFFIYHALPSKFQGGSELVAYNLIEGLSKKFIVTVVCFSTFKIPLKAYADLKKLGIKIVVSTGYNNLNKKESFIPKFYLNKDEIVKNQLFIETINIKKKDRLIAIGNIAISSAEKVICKKIAILEDPQALVKIQREKLSINYFNFYKKIPKLIYLKIFYKNFWDFLKTILKSYNKIFWWSKGEALLYQKKIDRKVNFIRCPIKAEKINKFKNGKFTIAMISYSITQDFDGIRILNKFLLSKLKKKNLLKKVNIYLVMNVFHKNLPKDINKILSNENVKLKNFDQKGLLDKIDLLYYPSKFKVGVRSKILFCMAKKILIATNEISKYGIPELKSNFNCLSSNNNFELADQIINIIDKKKKINFLNTNAYNLIKKNYFPKKAIDQIAKSIK